MWLLADMKYSVIKHKLKIFPIPKNTGKMWFEYYKSNDKSKLNFNEATDLITNVGEVPYSNPTYSYINSVGRQWIFNYTLALCKEVLAYIRGKYQSVPVPGSEATLNQADLLADARTEKDNLLTNLREMLDQTSRGKQLEAQAIEGENLEKTLKTVPMTIYIG